MSDIFLYVSNGLILISYISYFILVFYGKSKKISNDNCFNIVKDILSEYDSINVIESKNFFTVYNMKRRVIKLSSNCYYGDDLCSISLSLIEAGISVIDKKNNKFLNFLRNIFNNLKFLYVFPIISLLINNSSYNINDAKVSIIFLSIFVFFSFILLDIKTESSFWIDRNLKKIKLINKEDNKKIVNFINRLIFFDKVIYFGELIMVIRLLMIIVNI